MRFVSPLAFFLLVVSALAPGLGAQETAPVPPVAKAVESAAPSLVVNGDFSVDSDGNGWPDGWSKGPELSWHKDESGRPFLRLTALEPGKMTMLYRELSIPEGVKAFEVGILYRTADIRKGRQSWNDARAMFQFLDENGGKLKTEPSAAVFSSQAADFIEISRSYIVPEGARLFKVMPCLFEVQSGTLDLAGIRVTPLDADRIEVLKKEEEEKAAKRLETQALEAEKKKQQAEALLARAGSILSNGNFETDSQGTNVPDGWGKGEGISWERDGDGNHFMRLNVVTPGKMVMLYRKCDLPEGAAMELAWRQRVSGLKKGKLPWHDVRILMEFHDAGGRKMKTSPGAPNTGSDTKGWVERKTSFLVPEGAVSIVLMPALFEAAAGTFDLDDLVLKPADPAPLLAKAEAAQKALAARHVAPEEPNQAKWPKELRVQGNRLVDSEGRDVWLQGVNACGMENVPDAAQVIKSAVVGVEDWKSNCIRLPVITKFWRGNSPYQQDGGKAYREAVDQIITLVTNRGAYLVIDLHRFKAPRQEDVDFWKEVAAKYKNHPGVLFDLLNEPFGTSWQVWRDGGFIEEKQKGVDESAFLSEEDKKKNLGFQSVGMQALVDAVRATGARNIVIAGGLDWAYDLSGIVNGYELKDSGGNGIMYSSHIYPWKRDWQKKVLEAAAKHPIFVGEVGADIKKMDFLPLSSQEDPSTWVPDMLGLIQKYRLHWTGWSFHPQATPVMLLDWNYTPTPFWGLPAKEALLGKEFKLEKMR